MFLADKRWDIGMQLHAASCFSNPRLTESLIVNHCDSLSTGYSMAPSRTPTWEDDFGVVAWTHATTPHGP